MSASHGHLVLLVSDTPHIADTVAAAIERGGYEAVKVREFRDAQVRLSDPPVLVVTELKLGAFNGLHLALHAAEMGIHTIVIADESYRREIEQLGATWVSPEAACSEQFTALITEAAAGWPGTAQRFPFYAMANAPLITLSSWALTNPSVTH